MCKITFHEYFLKKEMASIKKENNILIFTTISLAASLVLLVLFIRLEQNLFHKNLRNDLPNVYSILQDYQKVVLCKNSSIKKVSKEEIMDIVNYSPEYARLYVNSILLPETEYGKFKQEKLKENCQ